MFVTGTSRLKGWSQGELRLYTAISRKVVGKNVHATIPKGNMGYDRYTVPDDCRVSIQFFRGHTDIFQSP